MTKKLLFPDDVRAVLKRRYETQQRRWLLGGGVWPLQVLLGAPTERDVASDVALVRAWVDAWGNWSGTGHLTFRDVTWPRLGHQRLPARLELVSPSEVAVLADDGERFERARARATGWLTRFPCLDASASLGRHFDVFADYSEADYGRLAQLIAWLLEHPQSGYLVRQLPVEGLDTKWLEKRRALVVDLLELARNEAPGRDFFSVCGLRPVPHRFRMRVLCPRLRRVVGGLTDIEAPLEQLAGLDLVPARVLVVENLETGLALPELHGCVAFMKLGFGVTALSTIPWLKGGRFLYWGDLDTHGFAILDQARACLGDVTSLLMDEETLLAHRALWGEEPRPYDRASMLPSLTDPELRLFQQLRANVWGQQVRLEQERIPWMSALDVLRVACAG